MIPSAAPQPPSPINSFEFERNTEVSSNLPLIALVQRHLSPGLRSLFMIGSCLAEETRKKDSIPDLFALVDDVDSSLDRMDVGLVARRVSPLLPPTTVSLCAAEREP